MINSKNKEIEVTNLEKKLKETNEKLDQIKKNKLQKLSINEKLKVITFQIKKNSMTTNSLLMK